ECLQNATWDGDWKPGAGCAHTGSCHGLVVLRCRFVRPPRPHIRALHNAFPHGSDETGFNVVVPHLVNVREGYIVVGTSVSPHHLAPCSVHHFKHFHTHVEAPSPPIPQTLGDAL